MNGTIRASVALAAAAIAASLAITSAADARSWRHSAGCGINTRVRMYAADHYRPLPYMCGGGGHINNNFNPDFQLGGGHGQ